MFDAYRQTIEQTFAALESTAAGLSDQEAQQRLDRHGLNRLTPRKKATALGIFFRQFLNPLVYILAAAATIKAVVKGPVDALTIFAVLFFMAVVGFIQEYRAGKAMDALLQLSAPKAKVRRNSALRTIEAEQIVPGDIIEIEAGDKVPADSRLIEAVSLAVNESSLTGESLPAPKSVDPIAHEAVLGERRNMLYTGTAAVAGRGAAVVTATGMETEIGKIAAAVRDIKEEKTSLQRSIDGLGHSLVWIILGVCGLLVALGLLQKMSPVDIFMLAVAAAVAAIPEGLPAVVTVVLATGMQRMARHRAIVRKLIAVETLGATTVICSDKTGTLTMNQMTVKEIYVDGKLIEVGGEGYSSSGGFSAAGRSVSADQMPPLQLCLRIAVLCNNAAIARQHGTNGIIGDPTEGALVVVAAKAGMLKDAQSALLPRLDEIPFQSERQYMATLHQDGPEKRIFVKGSVEKLLSLAGYAMRGGARVDLHDALRADYAAAAEKMGRSAMRVLALACADVSRDARALSDDMLQGRLVIVGLMGMIDPPREEARTAIAACHGGGIQVVMATGDNIITGQAIASRLGIRGSRSFTGSQMNGMSDDELDRVIADTAVFARIEPLHKMRIIQAFKRRGHVVAMTGDGVNDAPALESADIGVAMGVAGTDVAKEASDMVLADDNFSTIVTAVEEGRAIFSRLRNVILFQLTTCFGELLSLILAILFTGQPSLVPLQILWINLVTGALLAIPLGLEPRTGDELRYPPRNPKAGLMYRGMLLRVAFLSSMLGIGSFLVFLWTLGHYDIHEARTMAFTSIVVFEWLVAFNARSDEHTIFRLGFFKNGWLFAAIIAGVCLQAAVIYIPFLHRFFDTVPLRGFEWAVVLLPGLVIFIIETLRKILAPKLFNSGKW